MKKYKEKDYGACADLFERSFAEKSQYFVDDMTLERNLYSASCCLALAGRGEAAAARLEKAIENPAFVGYDHMMKDQDLTVLHNSQNWEFVLKAAKAAMQARSPITYPSLDRESAKKNPPLFPREAMKADASGIVVLVVTVGADASPKKILIEQSSGDELLDSAAAETAKTWQYRPGVAKDGTRFSGRVRVPIEFRRNRKF